MKKYPKLVKILLLQTWHSVKILPFLQCAQNMKQFISLDSPSWAEQNGTNSFVVACTVVEIYQFKYKYFKSHVTEVFDSAHITYVHMPLYKRVCVFHISHAVWVPTGSAGAWDRELVVESGEGRANRRCCECHPSPLNLYRCQSVVLTYPSLSSCLSIRSCVGLEAADECCGNSACHSTERIRTLAHSFYPRPSILHT